MPEWLSIAVSVGAVLVPLFALVWSVHRASVVARTTILEKIEHLHQCLERRADRISDAMHNLECRVVAIETRGHQTRRSDYLPQHQTPESGT